MFLKSKENDAACSPASKHENANHVVAQDDTTVRPDEARIDAALLRYRVLGIEPVRVCGGLAVSTRPGTVSLVCLEATGVSRPEDFTLSLLDALELPASYAWSARTPDGVQVWLTVYGVRLLLGDRSALEIRRDGCEVLVISAAGLRHVPPTPGHSFFVGVGVPDEPPAVVSLKRLADLAAA